MRPTVDFDKQIDYLKADDNILFALVFGPANRSKITSLSDGDIGIYSQNEIPLLEMERRVNAGTFGKEIMHNNIRDRMILLEKNLSDFSLKSAYEGD